LFGLAEEGTAALTDGKRTDVFFRRAELEVFC